MLSGKVQPSRSPAPSAAPRCGLHRTRCYALGCCHRKQTYLPFGQQPGFHSLPPVRAVWIAGRARVGRLVGGRDEAAPGHPSFGRIRLLARPYHWHKSEIPELDFSGPTPSRYQLSSGKRPHPGAIYGGLPGAGAHPISEPGMVLSGCSRKTGNIVLAQVSRVYLARSQFFLAFFLRLS